MQVEIHSCMYTCTCNDPSFLILEKTLIFKEISKIHTSSKNKNMNVIMAINMSVSIKYTFRLFVLSLSKTILIKVTQSDLITGV